METSMLSKESNLGFWKLSRGCVPTRAFLYSRGLAATMQCQRCNSEGEPFNTYCFSARGLYKYGILLNLNVENKETPFNLLRGVNS